MEEKESCILRDKTTKVLFASSMGDLAKHLSQYGSDVLWVFDENVASSLFKVLPERSIVIKSGEAEKNLATLERILERAVELGMSRKSRFIAFGGGVVCDMTALAASLYMRGARLTLVPTTLLSMVDASLGGKTAVDFMGLKNLIGSFYPAEEVLIAPDTLKKLPEYEYRCGMGEVIKHALLTEDASYAEWLLENKDLIGKRDKKCLIELVDRSLRIKKSFIESDPEDKKGRRAMLNFGHTFGHALESLGLFSISHGEGVVWGIRRALEAGVISGITSLRAKEKTFELLDAFGFEDNETVPEDKIDEFISIMHKDKKSEKGIIHFVLLDDKGMPTLGEVSDETVRVVISR